MIPLTKIKGKEFDVLRKLFLGKDAQLVLLREDGSTAAFETLATIASGWHSKFSEFFGNQSFYVADITTNFGSFSGPGRKVTHLMVVNSKLPTLNNVLHETLAETAAPDASKPWWRIRAKSVGRKYVGTDEI